jgi:hypothetical protein
MRIKLVFDDWRNEIGVSVYNAPEGVTSSIGDFHSGTTFDGIITLEEDQHKELESSLEKGFIPVFHIRLP